MNRNLFVTSLLCVLGVSAWAVPSIEPEDPLVQPTAIVGNDGRENITGRGVGPEQAVVVLEMKMPKGTGGCSGSLVAPNVVLTAAHCLYMDGSYIQAVNVYAPGLSSEGSNGQIQNPGPEGQEKVQKREEGRKALPPLPEGQLKGKTPSKEMKGKIQAIKKKKNALQYGQILWEDKLAEKVYAADVAEFGLIDNVLDAQHQSLAAQAQQDGVPSAQGIEWWVPEEWKNAPHDTPDTNRWINEVARYDYGIVILKDDNELGQKIEPLRIAEKADKSLRSMGLVIIGRGGDKPLQTLWKGEGMIKRVADHYFMHDADMMPGNSGGPAILLSDRYTIVGLNNFHFGANKQKEGAVPNGCLRINDKIVIAVADAKAGKPLAYSSKTDKPGAKRPQATPKARRTTPKSKQAPKSSEEIIPILKAKRGQQ